MTLEQQVCSIDLAKKLHELAYEHSYFAPSVFYWEKMKDGYELCQQDEPAWYQDGYNAFTVAELGEMLPWIIDLKEETAWLETTKNGPHCEIAGTYSLCYAQPEDDGGVEATNVFSDNSEADARAKMLIYLIENDLLTPSPKEDTLKNTG